MAAVTALHAVSAGLAQHLTLAHQISPVAQTTCTFSPVSAADFKKLDGSATTLSIFVYRLSYTEQTRNSPPSAVAPGRDPRRPVLSVNLHLLLTVWADQAIKELTLLAWVLRELHQRPLLDRSLLAASGGFAPGESVQLIAEELSMDDLTKLWQALSPPLRPSLTYIARNVQISLDPVDESAPVAATRFRLSDEVEAP